MNNFFYLTPDGQQHGPVAKELLKTYGITRDTLVWADGMAAWTKAGEVPELAFMFGPVPPPPPPGHVQPPYYAGATNSLAGCPDSYLVWAILVTVFCCWPFGIPAIVNATKVEKLWLAGDKNGALEKSENAKKWCWISFGFGLVTCVLSFCMGFLGYM